MVVLAGCGDERAVNSTPAATSQPAAATRASAGAPILPDPSLTPTQVLHIVLDAFAHNDTPSPHAGIVTAFAFASPRNKQFTGPYERFEEMVMGSYAPMLNHSLAEYGPLLEERDTVRQMVAITDAHGVRRHFVFELIKQKEGAFAGCWMMEQVIGPLVNGEAPPPATQPASEDADSIKV